MKPLPTNQRVLTWLCLFPASENTSNFVKLGYIVLTFVCITCMTANLIASVAFFIKSVSTELEKSLFALFQIVGSLSVWYMFITVFPSQHKIHAIFRRLSQIYDESKNCFIVKTNYRFHDTLIELIPLLSNE